MMSYSLSKLKDVWIKGDDREHLMGEQLLMHLMGKTRGGGSDGGRREGRQGTEGEERK